ncbi:uncharacterized protein LAJ45_00940 [Morchella importuna]|uniref:uncharacterized protein n=1 Tax=Morchella importuna TaxID=1174673 RepID=UPI001E8E9A9A|nr:uncharacterized protein LAJ45_00940 [Morchella importuna]KAH8154413.1 hypothetical protein LAJ45_00940 [Morchella importuna]
MSMRDLVLFTVTCIIGLGTGLAAADAPRRLRPAAGQPGREETDDELFHRQMQELIAAYMLRLPAEEEQEVATEMERADSPTAAEVENIRIIARRNRQINEGKGLTLRHRIQRQYIGQPPNHQYLNDLTREINRLQRLNNRQQPNPLPVPAIRAATQPNNGLPVNFWRVRAAQIDQQPPRLTPQRTPRGPPADVRGEVQRGGRARTPGRARGGAQS